MDHAERMTPMSAREITLRPEREDDNALLFSLYASTRAEELALTGWDDAARAQFLQTQFRSQRVGYQSMFPNAQFEIILADGAPIGRIVVNRASDEIRVVDLVLLPEHCNGGIGSRLMAGLIEESFHSQRPLRLHVVRGNRALRFYQRHGFVPLSMTPTHLLMERVPAPRTSCNPV